MFLKGNKFLILGIVFTLVMATLIAKVSENSYLVIYDHSNDESHLFNISDGVFILGYTHSVMKTECLEIFETEGTNIVLKETVYESYGVGLPFLENNEDEGEYELVDGKFHLKMNRSFEVLPMYISEIPNHFIEIKGERKYFNDFLIGDTKIILKVK